jgi:adenosine/AMP kinase
VPVLAREDDGTMELQAVPITIPDDANVIVGQSHFIKTVSDLHETLAGSSPTLRFGAAFCEASGPRLIRRSRNDEELVGAAVEAARAIGAGHCFVVYLRHGYPVNVMNALKRVPEVCRIICATANPLEVLVAVTDRGRGIIGVVDGETPLGVENDDDVTARLDLLRAIGYRV